ncbi:hypothetical protein [Actinomadura opuntiae]|uniref:hypothetical protein n=1 Tax=Actinomadura sp. OS1-43 TaxID=604315 RepID=UPI00255A7AD3|nr:hypothetical protein [Actinomadura sp. OS1-43]MDL4818676.1 hypothetical protein [Actinomadura sp. OS1-43]
MGFMLAESRGHTKRITAGGEEVMAPLLRAALFYVTTASGDLAAARAELADLHTHLRARPPLGHGEGKQVLMDVA